MELLAFDLELFHLINGEWHHPFFDAVIPWWRHKLFWMPFYLFLLSFLAINFGKKGLLVIVCLVATLGAADFVSSTIIKKSIQRTRPCNERVLDGKVRELVRCGHGYSFTSSHAANHTAIAFFLIFTIASLFKWIKIPLFLWAFSIGYSQIYVGVHYPLDVIGGMLVGFIIGLLGAEICRMLMLRFFNTTLDVT